MFEVRLAVVRFKKYRGEHVLLSLLAIYWMVRNWREFTIVFDVGPFDWSVIGEMVERLHFVTGLGLIT